MTVAKVDLATPGGKMVGQLAYHITEARKLGPLLNAYIAQVGNAAAIEAATAEFGATTGSGQIIIDTAYELNDKVQAISAADAAKCYQGELP